MRFAAPPDPDADAGDLAARFIRWSFARGACARGYWLAASIYLVVVADLSPAALVLIGAAQAITVLVAEVPAGVFADTVSRKWSLVIACGIAGAGMAMAGLVTSLPALMVSQMLWGLGWAFASGADVAWITDELDRPDLIDRLLAASARWELIGAAAGVVAFGLIAVAAGLASSVVLSGVLMMGLGVLVAGRFPEVGFTPAPPDERWRRAAATLRGGVRLVRGDRVVLLILAAWFLVNGSGAGYGRLIEKELIAGDLPATEAVVWFSVLSLGILALSAGLLLVVEHRIGRPAAARRAYMAGCAVGVVGLLAFAHAPDRRVAVAAMVLAGPAVHPGAVVRAVGEIWVNGRTSSAVRATVLSLLSQSEHLAEFAFGLGLAALAHATSAPTTVTAAAALLAAALLVIARARPVDPAA